MTSGSPTSHQYISLAVAITESAFWDYCELRCDLYCLRHPTRSVHTKRRSESVKVRGMKRFAIPASSNDVSRINRAVRAERERLKRKVETIERFFEKGICGLAFHFDGGNAPYLRKLSDGMINGFVETGVLKQTKWRSNKG